VRFRRRQRPVGKQRLMPHLRTSGTSRLTLLDYARAIASQRSMATTGEIISVVRLHADANCEQAEYANPFRSHGAGDLAEADGVDDLLRTQRRADARLQPV